MYSCHQIKELSAQILICRSKISHRESAAALQLNGCYRVLLRSLQKLKNDNRRSMSTFRSDRRLYNNNGLFLGLIILCSDWLDIKRFGFSLIFHLKQTCARHRHVFVWTCFTLVFCFISFALITMGKVCRIYGSDRTSDSTGQSWWFSLAPWRLLEPEYINHYPQS